MPFKIRRPRLYFLFGSRPWGRKQTQFNQIQSDTRSHQGLVSQSSRQLSGPLSCFVFHCRWTLLEDKTHLMLCSHPNKNKNKNNPRKPSTEMRILLLSIAFNLLFFSGVYFLRRYETANIGSSKPQTTHILPISKSG